MQKGKIIIDRFPQKLQEKARRGAWRSVWRAGEACFQGASEFEISFRCRRFINGHLQDRATDLRRQSAPGFDGLRLPKHHERPELRGVVLEEEAAILKTNSSVTSANRHIGDANVALVATANLQLLLLSQRDDMKATIWVVLGVRLPDERLKNHERRFRLRHRYHWDPLPIHVHVRWISGVAQLTRKLLVEVASARARPFGEIEAALDPVPQALQMNVPNSPLASARANERVVIGTPFKEADAASDVTQCRVFWTMCLADVR